jgi:hypothetical protein
MNPVYDVAYYEDLAGRLYGLVIRLGDRLSGVEARWLHQVTAAGEYGLALDDLAKILACATIAITGQERGDILALAGRMTPKNNAVSQALQACPKAATPEPARNDSSDTTASQTDEPRPDHA